MKFRTYNFNIKNEGYHFVTVKAEVSKDKLINNLSKAYHQPIKLNLEQEFDYEIAD